ncbi:uncharacterized protein LOC122001794 isoform X1 [Zingiber officinale]|uniref:uncharacterized protein LOC122001794 isoform X1 n=1 Tax=Zingiber officinale TaxID=94328 RepID=UPI001C4D3F20|nr:uncharacterized protein LOC122001794 isoform X1 [Zingiber officinale]XP_042412656.1 uncharacterized protein LOC122001794 isoform X1 [Zingiber officinale]
MADESMLSMDFTTNLPTFGFWSTMQSADQCSIGDKTSLDLLQNLHDSDPIIEETTWEFKKFNEIKNLGYPLLGQSSSCSYVCKTISTSVSTASLIQETEEDSSVNVGLDMQLHLGGQNSLSPDKSSVNDLKVYHTGHLLDLGLSLSIVSSASAPSIAETITDPKLNSSSDSVFANQALSSNEEGSAHCWIFGACLQPCAVNLETTSSFSSERKECAEADSTSVVLNGKSTTMQAVDKPVTCTSGASNSQKHKNRISICLFQGCTKGARGASGLCIAHGGGQRCHRLGCQKGAEGRTIYCKAHGGGRRCQLLGCTKSAEGRTDYCIAHGGGRRCSHPSCTRAARGKSGLCIRHGGGKRCQWENCTKSAEGSSGLCIAHGGGRRCQIEDCTKGAQGGTLLCKAHGGGKRCTFLGCTKGAEGSTSLCKGHGGGKRCSYHGGGVCLKSVHGGTPFCVAHGGGKRCAVSGCPRSARGRTSFCVGHGGGKRCKFEGCEKSAQGSTDFCKAHGGGRRCSWGQPGSNFGAGEPVCNKLARGKIVLCAAHSALVQDHRVRGGVILGSTTIPYPVHHLTSQFGFSAPEGRVRGANLIPTLASRSGFGDNIGDQRTAVTSNHGASHISNATYLWM